VAKYRAKFTFPQQLVTEPIIYNMAIKHQVVTNIRRANVTRNSGWVILELEGTDEAIEAAIADVQAQGVRVEPVAGNMLEG
jgi:ABC-type methionine transport system ATPase subunit